MNKKGKAIMSDADSSQSRVRNPRRNKIIIRKCKKPIKTEESKSPDETKKVNGEFSSVNKDKENDNVEVEDDIQPKEVNSTEKGRGKGRKRKLAAPREDDEVIILEDASTVEGNRDGEDERGKEDSSVEFKGYKKRILSQTEQINDPNSGISEDFKNGSTEESVPEIENANRKKKIVKINRVKKKNVRSGKKRIEGEDVDDTQQESQAEYAQYLGLQPTMQFKCYRCGEKGFPSMLALNMHQRTCGISSKSNFIANLQQDSSSSTSDPNMLTNFRITRKVYLCSACGTYYENWNLFLHMRDVHKKHICLFCLTMFGMAEKLADHLKNTHAVIDSTFMSSEEFLSTYKGSCYLICCTCENMFSERGDYFHHQCVKRDPTAKCNLCGVKCGHYYTCPNSNQPRTLPAVTQATTVPKTTSSSLSKQHPVIISKNKTSEELWMGSKDTSFHDDDYDISHAASFCHVDIDDESGEKDKAGTKENPVDISDYENKNSKSSETKSTRQEPNTKDNMNSNDKNNQSLECESTKSKIKSPLEIILSKTSSEKDIDGKKTKQEENIESVEQHEECERNSLEKEDIEDVIGVKQSKGLLLETNIDQEAEKELLESENLDDIPTNNDHPRGSSSKEQNAEDKKVQDSKSGNSKPTSSPDKENDMTVCDSDDEPVTHLSDGPDASELSSDDDKALKKTQNKQTVDNGQDAINESDSDKSTLARNEEANTSKKTSEDANNTSTEFESQNDNIEELNRATFDETSKGFNLEDVIGVNRPIENGEEDKSSSDIMSPEQSQIESEEISDGIALAGEGVPAMALTLEDKLNEASSQSVVKECVRTSCLNCVYCSHANKIAVNGKQLALHLLAEHRYKPVKNNETSQDVVNKLKGSLNNLESIFFNTDSYDSSDKSLNIPYNYTYECFQCNFVTKVHKELYVHKRKMHQKTVLLCVMCKSNFYSYSELLCHMCPGIYALGDINFRCLFCNLDMIPSAFRLMVHLRKGHHTCDICLDVAGDQQKLSAHMWKHKLNHLCYRCGIAYRNKPDITKHLFWKHGTESVLCKKCLQKKWPHVYHFCIPPTVFICEECNASFTKAVALKVHKRFHSGEFPYLCERCDQYFVSRKLLNKHELSHNQPPAKETHIVNKINIDNQVSEGVEDQINVEFVDDPAVGKIDDNTKENEDKLEPVPELRTKKKKKKDKDRKGKAVLDVYDLPPLNLSSESDSSDDELKVRTEITKENVDSPETKSRQAQQDISNEKSEATTTEPAEENQLPVPIVDGVWDNFHSYKAELEKRESKDLSLPNILPSTSSTEPNIEISEVLNQPEVLKEDKSVYDWTQDHSYCSIPGKPHKQTINEEGQLPEIDPAVESSKEEVQESPAPRGHSSSIDHAYATLNNSSGEANNATSTEEPPPLDMPPTTAPQTVSPAESQPLSKKKQKTPKKKKHDTNTQDSSIGHNSSTSSDSSSDSDSSCSCVSNCSCSDSSSSSSSSSSSGSDSSTSEGRRRAAARKEKKKERLKHKNHKQDSSPVLKILPPSPPEEEEPIVDLPVEPEEIPIRESDLDTDVSSTEEDFYDQYPQSHNKALPIKRDLMLLASVAPVNNGTVSPPPQLPPPPPPPPTPPPLENSPQTSTSKRKVKTKKRKKSQQSKKGGNKTSLMRQKTNPSTSINFPSPSQMTNYHNQTSKVASPLRTPATFPSDTAGSGSENESARSSKRKRFRNRFYGYSSDEEFRDKSNVKWKKAETNIQPFTPPPPGSSFQPSTTHKSPHVTIIPPTRRDKSSESSGTDDEPRLRIKKDSSNSSSTESETEFDSKGNIPKDQQTEKSDNLYCYCQCPYDEVSEMIACDGQDCTIEWFHFECVGIMVPPKGKWYCPDCRKRRDLM